MGYVMQMIRHGRTCPTDHAVHEHDAQNRQLRSHLTQGIRQNRHEGAVCVPTHGVLWCCSSSTTHGVVAHW